MRPESVERLEERSDGVGIAFARGEPLERHTIFIRPPTRQRSDLATQLGCNGLEDGSVELESLEPESGAGRVAVVLVGAAIVLLTLALAKRSYPLSFFRGFLVAVGVIFSFDIVVFHWVFGLHRITAGSEANVIEPIVVATGLAFVALRLRGEGQSRRPVSRR